MTATAEPPTEVLAPAPAPSALARAEGVELLGDVHGSGYKEGAALVRRGDGQVVQLGPLMYALLESVDGRRTTTELADALCEKLGRDCDEEHVVLLAEKLAAKGLLAGYEQNAPPRRNPLLALRWKVLVTNPRITTRLTAPFAVMFRPWLMWPILAAFVAVFWFVLIHKGVAGATAQAFHRPGLLLLVFILAVISAGFLELGHAASCRYGGATPGGMGMGLYLVWPAFYTDVTDAYRLPRRDRLRVDLGGLYFNAVVAVATTAVWFAWRVDALLLLIALQLLIMVKNLSPVIRSDGYHILADATGVPDLYAHIGPTLRRLLPGRRDEPSALHGRARLLVTLWVLIVVPVLLSLMLGAILLLPRLLTTAWNSGHRIASTMPHESALHAAAGGLQLVALALPVLGSLLITQKLARTLLAKGWTWSDGRPVRRTVVVALAAATCCGAAWAWWPSGQYQPVRPTDNGTLTGLSQLAASPRGAIPVAAVMPVHLAPGTHLAVSLVPVGGASKAHPAYFVVPGKDGDPPVALISDGSSPLPAGGTTTSSGAAAPSSTTTAPTTSSPQASGGSPQSANATAFPFTLPAKPGPGDSQALAVNTNDGSVKYDIAYSLVTVKNGAPVTNRNSAFALASCNACTTVAVSFQVVLAVGVSNTTVPIDAAGALNYKCPACVTAAVADQIVVTLRAKPSKQLLAKLDAALQQLNALPKLGANATPSAVVAQVAAVQQQIVQELNGSGLLANPIATTTAPTTTATTATTPAAATATTTASTGTTTTTSSGGAAGGTSPPPVTTTQAATTATTPTTTDTTPTTTSATTTGP